MMNIPQTAKNWLYKVFRIPYRLHVQDWGGNGTPIILLHGIAASSASWDKLIPLLAPDFRCITIDLLGFGNSPKPQDHPYSLEEHTKSLHRTIRSLKLKQPYILAGHSLGSLLAAHYTRVYSPELTKLCMISPPIYVTDKEPAKIRIRLRVGAYAKAYTYLRTHRRFTLAGAKRLKKILKNANFVLSAENWIPFERSLEQCIENQDVLADLKQINTPTEIFYGEKDRLIIPGHIEALANLEFVNVHKVDGAHVISTKYAENIARNLKNA